MIDSIKYSGTWRTAVGLLAVGVWGLTLAGPSWAQLQGYGTYYQRNVGDPTSPYPGADQYLYDRYFYHNSAINPYLSTQRGPSAMAPPWQTSVVPEVQRRARFAQKQQALLQQRKLEGNVGHTYYGGVERAPLNAPSTRPWRENPYYRRLYGGVMRR